MSDGTSPAAAKGMATCPVCRGPLVGLVRYARLFKPLSPRPITQLQDAPIEIERVGVCSDECMRTLEYWCELSNQWKAGRR